MIKGYRFSSRSETQLSGCHAELQLLAHEALSHSQIDFAVTEGHRSIERQKQLFDAGRSRIDGINKRGKHNHSPSLAFDLCAIVKGKASWKESHMSYLGGVLTATAQALYAAGRMKQRLRWGGNWDGDGEIITDQSFIDLPHFELQQS